MVLTKHSIICSLKPMSVELKDEVVDKMTEELTDAVEMILKAALENLTERFPHVHFTIREE